MSFHLPDMATLRKALDHLKSVGVDIEDPGSEIGPEAPGSKTWALVPRSRRLPLGTERTGRQVNVAIARSRA